jgi:hypothetical protein
MEQRMLAFRFCFMESAASSHIQGAHAMVSLLLELCIPVIFQCRFCVVVVLRHMEIQRRELGRIHP